MKITTTGAMRQQTYTSILGVLILILSAVVTSTYGQGELQFEPDRESRVFRNLWLLHSADAKQAKGGIYRIDLRNDIIITSEQMNLIGKIALRHYGEFKKVVRYGAGEISLTPFLKKPFTSTPVVYCVFQKENQYSLLFVIEDGSEHILFEVPDINLKQRKMRLVIRDNKEINTFDYTKI